MRITKIFALCSFLLLLIIFYGALSLAWGESLYARGECQTYKSPSKSSDKFFFKPTARKALTLDKNHLYTILGEKGDWVQVDVFGTMPWVEKKCMADQLHPAKDTLKKNATVCRTKAQFNEIVEHREDRAYVMNMLVGGKCKMNLSDEEVPVVVLEGLFPMVKLKMRWNDEIFVGWTDAKFINE